MCSECGCHSHRHLAIMLPVQGIDSTFKATQLQQNLTKLHGINNVVADIKKQQVCFTMTEHGDLGQVKQAIRELGMAC